MGYTSVASLGLCDRERDGLRDFCDAVRALFGLRIRELALFGSRARGEGTDESDLDVVVVIDGLTSAEGRSIAHLAGDALTYHDVLVSPFAVSTDQMSHLRERERLIAREIARDSLPL